MALGQDGNSKNSPSVKPFDASNSFVKKIANRVTGLIGWRSNSYENAEDLNPEDLPNISLTDDEAISPNPKRIKLLHNAEPHSYPMKPVTKDGCNITQSVNDSNVAGPSFRSKCMVASTPAVNYCVETSPQHSGNVTDYLDTSAPSNISSPLPSCSSTQQRHNITIPGVLHKDLSTVTTYDFNKSLNETSTMMNKRRPSFNAEVFSASNKRLSLSVCESRNRSCLSPFYSARTMYGGASALLPYSSQSGAKLRTESASNLNVFSPRNQITIQPVPSPHKGGANDQETMSAAARRILDTLERYCSPIKDAKRIPMNESSTRCEDDRTFTSRGIKRKLPSLAQITPSTADLLRIKRQEKMQDSILNARQVVSTVPEPSTSTVADLDSSSDSTDLDYTVFNDDKRRKEDVPQITKRKDESKYDDRPVSGTANVSKSGPNAVFNLANLPKYEITESFTFSKPLTVENFDEVADEGEDENTRKASAITYSAVGKIFGGSKSTQNLSGGEQRSGLSTASSNTPSARTGASGEFKSFTSPSLASRNNFGGNEAPSALTTNQQLLSKSNIINNTTSNKYFQTGSFSSVSKPDSRWTCKKCLLDNNGDKCSSCSSSRPEQDESLSRPDDKSLPSTATGSNEKSPPIGGILNKNNNKLVVNNTSVAGSAFGTFNDSNRNKSISGGDRGFGATKSTNTKDNTSKDSSPLTTIGADDSKKNEATASSTSNQSQPNDLWKSLQKSSAADQWSCDACWVMNKKTDATCVACGSPNPSAPQTSNTDQVKTAASSKPSFTFGIPIVSTEMGSGAIKFGSPISSTEGVRPATSVTFGFGNTNAITASTPATSANTAAKFSFGTATNAEMNTSSSYSFGIKKAENSTVSFGLPSALAGDTNKTTNDKISASSLKTSETGLFNDSTGSTNNKKSPNPFSKFGTDVAANVVPIATTNFSKTNLMQKSIMTGTSSQVVKENGEDSLSPSNIFNDVASFGTNSPIKKKPSTGGFPPPASFGVKDSTDSATAAPAQSNPTSNTFGSSNGSVLNNNEFKLPSPLTNNISTTTASTVSPQTGNLFASASFSSSTTPTLGTSKPNDVLGSASFGSTVANNANTGSSFGSMNSSPFASQPLMFGNTALVKKDKTDLSTATETNKTGSLFPMINNNATNAVFGGSITSAQRAAGSSNSTFGNFNSISNVNSVDATSSSKSVSTAEPAVTTTPSLNFNNAASSTSSPFRFGVASNTSTSSQQNNNQSGSGAGGFAFNGPSKLDNSMMPPPQQPPKFGAFGGGSSSSTGATFGSVMSGATPNFNFGATPAIASTDNSNATPFASVIKPPTQDTMLKSTSTTPSFGSIAFGSEPIKKSGGFNFTASNPMSTPTMSSFSGLTSPINDNQNRLNNSNAASATTPFVFGGSSNPSAPAHNFNMSVPSSFNFNSTPIVNSIPTFTATPQPATGLSTTALPRKIKKAVRRTNK